MPQVNVNFRIDSELKKQFEKFCDDNGLTLTTALLVYIKKTLNNNCLPFVIGEDIPNAFTRTALDNVKKGINLSRGFSSVEELMEDLNADN